MVREDKTRRCYSEYEVKRLISAVLLPASLATLTRTDRVPYRHGSRSGRRFGRIAQLVEQLTLNQRVLGSSPCAPTIEINDLAHTAENKTLAR